MIKELKEIVLCRLRLVGDGEELQLKNYVFFLSLIQLWSNTHTVGQCDPTVRALAVAFNFKFERFRKVVSDGKRLGLFHIRQSKSKKESSLQFDECLLKLFDDSSMDRYANLIKLTKASNTPGNTSKYERDLLMMFLMTYLKEKAQNSGPVFRISVSELGDVSGISNSGARTALAALKERQYISTTIPGASYSSLLGKTNSLIQLTNAVHPSRPASEESEQLVVSLSHVKKLLMHAESIGNSLREVEFDKQINQANLASTNDDMGKSLVATVETGNEESTDTTSLRLAQAELYLLGNVTKHEIGISVDHLLAYAADAVITIWPSISSRVDIQKLKVSSSSWFDNSTFQHIHTLIKESQTEFLTETLLENFKGSAKFMKSFTTRLATADKASEIESRIEIVTAQLMVKIVALVFYAFASKVAKYEEINSLTRIVNLTLSIDGGVSIRFSDIESKIIKQAISSDSASPGRFGAHPRYL